jgi:hypothetical protein
MSDQGTELTTESAKELAKPPPITPYVESAFQLARTKYGDEHRAWIDLSFRLAGRVSLAPLSADLQGLGDLDLVLRAMEDEHVANATSTAQGLSRAFHYQKMFSEIWVVLCYEALRAIRQRENEVADDRRRSYARTKSGKQPASDRR